MISCQRSFLSNDEAKSGFKWNKDIYAPKELTFFDMLINISIFNFLVTKK